MLNKDKILFITLDFPPQGGGQGIYIENIAQELTKKNYDVTVLTTKFSRGKNYKFPLKEISYQGQNPIIFIFLAYLYYFFKLKKENYSIIHGNSINHLLFLLFKNKKINYLTTAHNTYLQRLEAKDRLLYKIIYPIFIKIEKIVLDKSDKIIAVSRNTRNYLDKLTKNKNVFVVENGVNTDKYKPIEKDIDYFRFLYVGRIEKRKRVLETVKIFKEFLENYKGNKKIEFIIAGDGPEYKKVSEYVRENNLEKIKLVGFSDNVRQYYNKARCLLLLSRGEGLPLVLLESISCGLSAIVTKDASGLSSIVQEGVNGYIVEDELNREEIINKMIIITNKHKIFSEKSELMAKNYDWSIIINKYLKIYNI